MISSAILPSATFNHGFEAEPMIDPGVTIIGPQASAPISSSANARMPARMDVELLEKVQAPVIKKDPHAFAMKQVPFGAAEIDLGDGYQLTIDEAERSLRLDNLDRGTQTRIFGNARIDSGDEQELQFWGKTTFEFGEDGKITVDTLEAEDGSGDYQLGKITVSNERRGVVITGLGNEAQGDLEFSDPKSGYSLDYRTRDGLLVSENRQTGAWLNDDELALTQAYLNQTGAGGFYGPDTNRLSIPEVVQRIISRFLSGMSMSMLHTSQGWNSINDTYSENAREADVSQAEKRRLERILVEKMQMEKVGVE